MLGCLAMIANLIPYFGGIINNIVAAVTAFVISPALFIRTLIVFAILSMVDGYVINPLVYGKTNKVHPIVVIMSVFIGGALFGIIGIIISLPTAIILITTFKYFKDDVKDKIEDIKEKNIEN
jgi:predicted PurR-regulated permease PerM